MTTLALGSVAGLLSAVVAVAAFVKSFFADKRSKKTEGDLATLNVHLNALQSQIQNQSVNVTPHIEVNVTTGGPAQMKGAQGESGAAAETGG